jgi:hypothetical protein
MSGLWTPDGERPAPSRPDSPFVEPEEPSSSTPREPIEEEAALLAEIADAERQLLGARVEDVVANHCYGLFQLAALHLSQQQPHLVEARLAIDALSGIVDNLGDRLGESTSTLRDGLAQIRLAFVQIAGAIGDGSSPESPSNVDRTSV